MSLDHKPDDDVELKRIKSAGGTVIDGRVNGNLNLSRALGDHEYKVAKNVKPEDQMISAKPDIKRRSLNGTDLIVLGCDGIWEMKSNEEIGSMLHDEVIKKGKDLTKSTEELLGKLIAPNCDDENGLDNMTLIVVRLKSK